MSSAVALVVGPAEHGVVRHARVLAAVAGWPVVTSVDAVSPGGWAVLDVTDRLWGRTADVSGPALAVALDRLRDQGTRVAATVHDVPFGGDGAVFARRAAVYRGIVQRSDAVFVCSEVERSRLAELVPDLPPVAVLPLPVGPSHPVPPGAPTAAPVSVTVLGFVYPGKGHAEVLAAMVDLPPDVPLVCVGRAADGHDDLVASLLAGPRPVQITGFVSDPELAGLLQAATVPVAPNRVVSASASITTWWEYGRRPLAPDVAYTREIDGGSALVRYDDDLAGSLHRAFTAPASTWLADGVVPGPSTSEVARLRDGWLARWSA